jgi:hypothetical protein
MFRTDVLYKIHFSEITHLMVQRKGKVVPVLN